MNGAGHTERIIVAINAMANDLEAADGMRVLAMVIAHCSHLRDTAARGAIEWSKHEKAALLEALNIIERVRK